jgi:hypothetical protein
MGIKVLPAKRALLMAWLLSVSMVAFSNGPDDVGPSPEDQLTQLGIDTSLPSLEGIALNDTAGMDIRVLATLAIGRSENGAYHRTLVALLNHQHVELKGAAIIGLRRMGLESTIPDLSYVLETDSSELVQQTAVTAIEAIGGDAAVEALLDAASDPLKSIPTRANTLSAIRRLEVTGRLDYSAIKDSLIPFLSDRNGSIRSLAAHVMAAADDMNAVPYLADAALDDRIDSWIRMRAVRDLENMTKQDFGFFRSGTGPTNQAEREKAIQKIELWWGENRSKYETRDLQPSPNSNN